MIQDIFHAVNVICHTNTSIKNLWLYFNFKINKLFIFKKSIMICKCIILNINQFNEVNAILYWCCKFLMACYYALLLHSCVFQHELWGMLRTFQWSSKKQVKNRFSRQVQLVLTKPKLTYEMNCHFHSFN